MNLNFANRTFGQPLLRRLVKASTGGRARGGDALSYIAGAEEEGEGGVEGVGEREGGVDVYIPAPPHYIQSGAPSITPLSQMQVSAAAEVNIL